MNTDQFELNYLLLQEDIKTGEKEYLLPLLKELTSELYDPEVLAQYKDQIDAMKLVYVQLLLAKSKVLFEQKNYRESLKICSELLNLGATSEVFLRIAYNLSRLGYTDLALAYLYRVNPTVSFEKAYFYEVGADVYNQKQQPDLAVSFMEKSLSYSYSKDKEYKLAGYKIANDFTGWDLLESRFDKENAPAIYPKFDKPRWNIKQPKGKILVHWEQGFGDTIMFSRFLEKLRFYATKIYLAVRKPMLKLMQENFDFVSVVDAENLPSDYDYHIPLMSLMKELNITLNDVSGKSYLNAKTQNIKSDKRKVGIAWQGSPAGMSERNMTLLDFEFLFKRKDIQLYSFQKGVGFSSAAGLFQDLNLIDLGSTFKDFYDTACSLLSMDLFISTDNCLANLAGALGVPTILLLNHIPECRWMNAEEKTIWYDSIDIIKQKRNGDWSFCVEELNRRI